ncbi:hypothetical protein, partial [Mycoplasma enhydrae]|uniref:hypothetical protein n=1 Tax=Mycoplasma enhydrae TaxID=2499220 RepID=UPI00197B6D6F
RFITKSDFEFQIDPTKYQALVERMTIDDLSGSVYIRLKILLNNNQGVLIWKEYKLTTQPYVATIFKNFRPKNDVVDSLEDVKNGLLSGGSSQERINTLKKYFEWDNDLLPDEELFSIEVFDEDTIVLNLYTRISRSTGIYNEGNSSYNSKHHYPMGLKAKINENRKRWIEQNYRKFASANLWEVLDKKNRLSQLSVDDVRLKNMPVQLPKGMEFKKWFISPNENKGSITIAYKIIDHNNSANDKTYQTAELTGLQKYIPKIELEYNNKFLKEKFLTRDTLNAMFQRLNRYGHGNNIVASDVYLDQYKYQIWNFNKSSPTGEYKSTSNFIVKLSSNKHGALISYDVTYDAILGRGEDISDKQIKIDKREVTARVVDQYFDFNLLSKALFFINQFGNSTLADTWNNKKWNHFPKSTIDENNPIYKDFIQKITAFRNNSKAFEYVKKSLEQFNIKEFVSNIQVQKEIVYEWKELTKILSPFFDELINTTPPNERSYTEQQVNTIKKSGFLWPYSYSGIQAEFKKMLAFVTDNDNTLDENFFNV